MRKSTNFLSNTIRRSWKTALLIVIVVVVTIAMSTPASLWINSYYNLRFPSMGTIYTMGVEAYWDQNLTNRSAQIQWGTLYPNTETNITLYLHSISNIPTTLILKTDNWTYTNLAGTNITEPPNRQNYMNLTWNYNNQTLNPDQTIQTTLTLTVTDNPNFLEYLIQNNVPTFNFNISILAIETLQWRTIHQNNEPDHYSKLSQTARVLFSKSKLD
jgi:hypothetical protein